MFVKKMNELGPADTPTTIGLINYYRKKQIGQGGFGSVFLGECNGTKVAVKKIQLTGDQSYQKEEEALKNLHHSNVIKLLHCESDLDFRFLRKSVFHYITFFNINTILIGTTL